MKSAKIAIILGLILFFLPVVTLAGDLEDGIAAFERQDYEEAFELLKPLADEEVVGAYCYIGRMYTEGKVVTRDYSEAVRWLRKGAILGEPECQAGLGYLYMKGQGVPQDDAQAVIWYRKAAEQGQAQSQLNLGLMYSIGKGVPRDDSEAFKWYRLAAEQDLVIAQYNLGIGYHYGQGVPKDETEAVKWYRKAAEQGNADAQVNLGVMYHYGQGVPQDDEEAVRWFRKAAEQGDADAQFFLGLMYYHGEAAPQDFAEALKWYHKAAEQGHAEAQRWLGRMHALGAGTPQDFAEAFKWFRKSAEQGNAMAQYGIGLMYYEGKSVSEDHNEADKWFRKAAEQGNAKAQYHLGLIYLKGLSIDQDYEEAAKWFRMAVEQGDEKARGGLENAERSIRLSRKIQEFIVKLRVNETTENPDSRPVLHFTPATIELEGEENWVSLFSATTSDGQWSRTWENIFVPTWSPEGEWIAFTNNLSGLSVMNIKGDKRKIYIPRSAEEIIWHPAWSSDGKKLAFIVYQHPPSEPGTGHVKKGFKKLFSLVVFDLMKNEEISRISLPAETSGTYPFPIFWLNKLRWSSDGKKILISWRTTVVVNIEEESMDTITDQKAFAEWSHDNNGVYYFIYNQEDHALDGFYMWQQNNNARKQLMDKKTLEEIGIAYHGFAPVIINATSNNNLISITSTKKENGSVIYIYNLNANGELDISKPLKKFDHNNTITHVDWAPDESRLAVATVHESDSGYRIKVKVLDTENENWETISEPKATIKGGAGVDIFMTKFLSWTQ